MGRDTRFVQGRATIGRAIRAGNACLVLGAGAGCVCGAPDWEELARGAADSQGEIAGDLAASLGTNLPRRAEKRARVLQNMLYGPRDVDGSTVTPWRPPATGRVDRSSLPLAHVAEVARAIAENSIGRWFHVLTFNIDVFLEETLAQMGMKAVAHAEDGYERVWPPRSGFSRAERAAGPEVHVYHAHGVLVRPGDPVPSSNVIVTASEYDERALEVMSPSRLAVLHAFQHQTCLIYGFSFSDTAVRPLVRLASTAGPSTTRKWAHVALMPDTSFLADPKERRTAADKAWEKAEELGELGVNALVLGYDFQRRFLVDVASQASDPGEEPHVSW